MILTVGNYPNGLRKYQREKVHRLLNKMRWAMDHAPRRAVRRYQVAIFWLEVFS